MIEHDIFANWFDLLPGVIRVKLPNGYRDHRTEIAITAADWERSQAFTANWRVIHHYDDVLPVATDDAARGHPQWDIKNGWLLLSHFLMNPPDGHTVRHYDADTLNVTRDNLAVRKKGARLRAKNAPPSAGELLVEARQDRMNTIIHLHMDKGPAGEAFRSEEQRRREAKLDMENPAWREEQRQEIAKAKKRHQAKARRDKKTAQGIA